MKAPSNAVRECLSRWQTGAVRTGRKDDKDAAEHNRKAASLQDEIVRAVNDGPNALARLVRVKLELDSAQRIDAPELPRPLTDSEYRDPPLELERDLCAALPDLTPALAAQPAFWTLCHVAWIDANRFEPPLAPFFLGSKVTGKMPGKNDAAVRNLFRRMGGLPHVRGKLSVLADCPISCAWWRGHVARLAAHESEAVGDPFGVEDAHRVLHAGHDAWARLAGDSVLRITVVNSSRLQAALIHEYRGAARDKRGLPARELQTVVRELATLGAKLCFPMVPWDEMRGMVARAVAAARSGRGRI